MSDENVGTPPKNTRPQTSQPARRTGPSTGNNSGNDLPSEAKTQRDTRGVESGAEQIPGRDADGSEVTGSTGPSAPEAPDADHSVD